jgi:hypothetical protein
LRENKSLKKAVAVSSISAQGQTKGPLEAYRLGNISTRVRQKKCGITQKRIMDYTVVRSSCHSALSSAALPWKGNKVGRGRQERGQEGGGPLTSAPSSPTIQKNHLVEIKQRQFVEHLDDCLFTMCTRPRRTCLMSCCRAASSPR